MGEPIWTKYDFNHDNEIHKIEFSKVNYKFTKQYWLGNDESKWERVSAKRYERDCSKYKYAMITFKRKEDK